MINDVIKALAEGKIKPTRDNSIAFGIYEYPKSIKQAWKQFKMEIWLKQ
jgi:hypothetical protein